MDIFWLHSSGIASIFDSVAQLMISCSCIIPFKNWISPMSEHLYTFINPTNPKHLDRIDQILQNHGVIALPMGTSWAFCCNYMSKKGIDKLRKLNPNHPDDRPFSLICNEISMISQVGSVGNQNSTDIYVMRRNCKIILTSC